MSVEVALFILRTLAGICLFAFLLALFFIMFRSLQQAESPQVSYGRLSEYSTDSVVESKRRDHFELRPNTTLGRSPSSFVVVNDDFASAEHARVVLRDGHWWLEDCGSRNGTALNGEKIESPAILTDGDIIDIGHSRYLLSLDN